ncbi:MAG: hydrogenase iron-sulfur subunit [Armatimonadia bacterium]|nr:hydrogenase iron-sulfur subunit [Armatimonadia bacterium]
MFGRDVVTFVCRNSVALLDEESPELLGEAVRIVVPCAARVDALHVLRAVERGATMVIIGACPIGNCRSVTGPEEAEERLARAKALLDETGASARLHVVRAAANAPRDLEDALEKAMGDAPASDTEEAAR